MQTVRSINTMIANAPAVIVTWSQDNSPFDAIYRITRARTHKGRLQVRSLSTGHWVEVPANAIFEKRA